MPNTKMKEQVIPCLVDLRKDCSSSCKLYNEAKSRLNEMFPSVEDSNPVITDLREALSLYEPPVFVGIRMKNFMLNGDIEDCERNIPTKE
jgi:hypothetical protein